MVLKMCKVPHEHDFKSEMAVYSVKSKYFGKTIVLLHILYIAVNFIKDLVPKRSKLFIKRKNILESRKKQG